MLRLIRIPVVPATLKDIISCPQCGSFEVVYSCEPKCCFNHVCGDCRSTFELNTTKTGKFDHHAAVEAEEPPSGDPTTGCALCDSLKIAVLSVAGPRPLLLCGSCRAVLELNVEEFVPGGL